MTCLGQAALCVLNTCDHEIILFTVKKYYIIIFLD